MKVPQNDLVSGDFWLYIVVFPRDSFVNVNNVI